MARLILTLLAVVVACACASPVPSSPATGGLPTTIGGQPITYTERPASALGGDLAFFEGPIRAVGGDLRTARVAIGLGPSDITITSLRVPGADGRKLVDPLIAAAELHQTATTILDVGGRSVRVLTLPPTTQDRVYLYAFDDTAVIVTTAQASLADEVFRSLP